LVEFKDAPVAVQKDRGASTASFSSSVRGVEWFELMTTTFVSWDISDRSCVFDIVWKWLL